MNIVLFEAEEEQGRLAIADERAQHVLKVLRRKAGDQFDVGIIDGPRGKATLLHISEAALELSVRWGPEEPQLLPLDLIVGLCRPQTNRKILQEACSLGVRSMRFVRTERGEPSYAESKLWTSGEWRRHLVAGAAQAFSTRLPEVAWGEKLSEALAALGDGGSAARIALDNYEASVDLSPQLKAPHATTTLVIGSERGWTASERELLRDSGYILAQLGRRVLRTETAVVAAVGVLL